MAKIGLPKGSGKRLKVREKSVKSQGILKCILSGNPKVCNANINNSDESGHSHQDIRCTHTPRIYCCVRAQTN